MTQTEPRVLNTQPFETQNVQPAKLREARRFAELIAPRGQSAALFHAWRP